GALPQGAAPPRRGPAEGTGLEWRDHLPGGPARGAGTRGAPAVRRGPAGALRRADARRRGPDPAHLPGARRTSRACALGIDRGGTARGGATAPQIGSPRGLARHRLDGVGAVLATRRPRSFRPVISPLRHHEVMQYGGTGLPREIGPGERK